MKIFAYFSSLKTSNINNIHTNLFSSQMSLSYSRSYSRKRNYMLKLLGLSAVAIMTIRLVYNDTYAFEKSRLMTNIAQNNDEQLVSVIMLTRHGARTPLHILSKLEEAEYKSDLLDPFVQAKYKLKTLDNSDFEDILSYYDQLNMDFKLKGGTGRGQLTKVGEEQMYNLGRRVKDKYIDKLKFLSQNYNPTEI